jgi:hypothetical protein
LRPTRCINLSKCSSRNSGLARRQERGRPGVTPDGSLMRLPARHCSGSVASIANAAASWLTES